MEGWRYFATICHLRCHSTNFFPLFFQFFFDKFVFHLFSLSLRISDNPGVAFLVSLFTFTLYFLKRKQKHTREVEASGGKNTSTSLLKKMIVSVIGLVRRKDPNYKMHSLVSILRMFLLRPPCILVLDILPTCLQAPPSRAASNNSWAVMC
eukprot:TRINITY_DN11631_c0_g2_i1.p1 TRINITY_DN11631_c0_g2~~TRINITY_DN11631_c0_g2_i1.p1  ORF type:complete len:151 (-),score=21.85 TRINITY_DN11631_c0_g2_i1:287-739(-)